MKLSGVNPALMACAAIVAYWFTSIYGTPEKVNLHDRDIAELRQQVAACSKVEQHDRDIAAIFARLNARDEADRVAAAEALKREGFQKNQEALQSALKQTGQMNADAIRQMGEHFESVVREVHESFLASGLPAKPGGARMSGGGGR